MRKEHQRIKEFREKNGGPQLDEPQISFVKQYFETAAAPEKFQVFEQPVDTRVIKDAYMADIAAEADRAYRQKVEAGELDPSMLGSAISTRTVKGERVVSRFMDRATQMLMDGETDVVTVKSIFGRMKGFKQISKSYNALVKNYDVDTIPKGQRAEYKSAVSELIARQTDIELLGTFWHINGNNRKGEGTTQRYYIFADPNGQPAEVMKIWDNTLERLGLADELYYKVPGELNSRLETIIAYANPETEADMERAIEEFVKVCPPELLVERGLPTVFEHPHGGVSKAPEPTDLTRLLRYRGKETPSYNETVSGFLEMSLQRAAYEFIKHGVDADSVNPKDLSESARPYFAQYMKLAGIDPATMERL